MLYTILIGALAGFLAGKIMKGGGFGLLINIILGIVGAFLIGWLFKVLNISILGGLVGDLLQGFIGAVLLLFIVDLLKKKLFADLKPSASINNRIIFTILGFLTGIPLSYYFQSV